MTSRSLSKLLVCWLMCQFYYPPISQATEISAGDSGNLGQAQTAHPVMITYAAVDLTAGLPYPGSLSLVKITPSGKILFGKGQITCSSLDPIRRPVGYIWDKGVLTEILTPVWPWMYGSILGSVPNGPLLTFEVTDLNDAGTVVGLCTASGWKYPLGGFIEEGRETICMVWPATDRDNPIEFNPDPATPEARWNPAYVAGPIIIHHFTAPRIDQSGACYSVGNGALTQETTGWPYRLGFFYKYFHDVVKWTDPGTAPERITRNIITDDLSSGANGYSKLIDLSPSGNQLISTDPTGTRIQKHEVITTTPSSRSTVNVAENSVLKKITDHGNMIGVDLLNNKRLFIQNTNRPYMQLAGSYITANGNGDLLVEHANEFKMLWSLRRGTGDASVYIPYRFNGNQNKYINDIVSSQSCLGYNGVAVGFTGLSTDFAGNPLPAQAGARPLMGVPAQFITDRNHDSFLTPQFDPFGASDADTGTPFYAPVNDNGDNADLSSTTPLPDWQNTVVDGPDDIADFFPAFLDIKQLMNILPPSASIKYKLKQAEGGLNFVYTSLTRATAFDYENAATATTGYGPNADQAAAVATTRQITAAGVELPAAFLTRIKDQDQGVILLELRGMTSAPLRLVVEKDGVEVAELVANIATGEIKWESIYADNPVEDFKVPSAYADYTTKPLKWLEGKRYFVDGASAAAQSFRIRINAKVRLAGAAGKTVELRAFDVDDPTTVDWDSENLVDTNGLAGDDNRSGGAYPGDNGSIHEGTFSSAFLKTTTVTLDANGEATAEFILSQKPGNNYRIAGVLNESASQIDSLQVTDSTASRYVAPDAKPVRGFAGVISPTLTIWRKLNVEIDSMTAAPTGPSIESNVVTGQIHYYSHDFPSTGKSAVILDTPTSSNDEDQYQFGVLNIAGFGQYQVQSSPFNSLSSYTLLINEAPGAGIISHSFELRDDDDSYLLEANLPPPLPQDTNHEAIIEVVSAKYSPAFIQVVNANRLGLNPASSRRIDFKLNERVMGPGPAYASHFDDAKDLTDTEYFWAHTLVFGYQSENSDDGDPNYQPPLQGGTPKTGALHDISRGYSVVYIEANREKEFGYVSPQLLANPTFMRGRHVEYYKLLYGTVAHEIGHSPGKQWEDTDHDEGGLMQSGGSKIDIDFTPASVRRFRPTKSWSN